ncbi:hypothetical protein Tco_0499157, partial [Tanacetum coccineum]
METQKSCCSRMSGEEVRHVICIVNPKISHLHAVKRIFRYLKGQPKLGLWYPKDSPFDLVAYTDSDYAGASLDRKSTTGARVESSGDEESLGKDVSKQGRINAIDVDEDHYPVSAAAISNKRIVLLTITQLLHSNSKEEELSYELDEGLAREKDEANVALTEQWDDIQAKVDVVQETAEVDDDQETAKIKELMEIVPDEEEVAINDIPLATKPPTIGRIVGIKSSLMLFGISTILIDVNVALSKEVLLLLEKLYYWLEESYFLLEESYYCLAGSRYKSYYTTASTKLMLLKELMLLMKKFVLLIIIEQRVKVNQTTRILERKRRNHEEHCLTASLSSVYKLACVNYHQNLRKWTTPTLLWKGIFSLKKKKLIGVVKSLTGKLLRMVRSGILKISTTSKILGIKFPAIVYRDALASKPEVSSEPT